MVLIFIKWQKLKCHAAESNWWQKWSSWDVRPKKKMIEECSLHRMNKRERSTSGGHLLQQGNWCPQQGESPGH